MHAARLFCCSIAVALSTIIVCHSLHAGVMHAFRWSLPLPGTDERFFQVTTRKRSENSHLLEASEKNSSVRKNCVQPVYDIGASVAEIRLASRPKRWPQLRPRKDRPWPWPRRIGQVKFWSLVFGLGIGLELLALVLALASTCLSPPQPRWFGLV